ncbi:hypothetical protein BH18THE2_BH18THE2_09770 [soil metagenome]
MKTTFLRAALAIIFLPLMLAGPVTSILGQLVAYTPHVSTYAVPVFAQTASSADTGLQFAYTKIGVLGGLYQRVSFDSETKSLALSGLAAEVKNTDSGISSSQQSSQSQSNKKLSESEENNARQMINTNGFFQANSVYPPSDTKSENYMLHILAIKLDNRTHTVLWSDTSSNVPSGIISLAQAIEKLAQ